MPILDRVYNPRFVIRNELIKFIKRIEFMYVTGF